MPKKKKDAAPLKKKQLLKLQIQELEETLRSATEDRNGLAAKLATLATGYQELESKNKAIESDHASLITRHTSLVTAFKELETKHSSLLASSKETSEENELLILQLRQVQEELEHYFLENKKLSSRLLAAPAGSPLFKIDSIHFGHAEDSTPHRHLDFRIEGARLGEKSVGSISLRLVEHHGRAGLVVRAAADGSHPMELWREDGRENERAFLLVVPQDDQGNSFICEAKARDLILLRQSALLAAAHLANGSSLQSALPAAFWRSVALRFVIFLDEAHERLAAGDVEIEAGEAPDSFRFRICPALVGPNILAEVCGSWRDECLTLELPGTGEPPLEAWPRVEDGKPVESLALSFLRADQAEQKKLRASLTKSDRRLLRFLFEALPELVRNHSLATAGDTDSASPPIASRLDDVRKAAHVFSANGNRAFISRLLGRS
jgi:hypothetical protein